jgi:hypothetical protein
MKKIAIVCLLFLCSLSAISQEMRFVQGVVLGKDGQRLSGVTVKAQNADAQVCSKHNGTFEMSVPLFITKLEATNGEKTATAKIDGGYIVLKLNVPANENDISEVVFAEVNQEVPEGVVVGVICESGMMTYRGVNSITGKELFRYGPIAAAEDVGEFLAVVNALVFLKSKNSKLPVFFEKEEVLSWVKKNKCKAQIPEDATEQLKKSVSRSEKWLKENNYKRTLMKWNSAEWGENPACKTE